MTEALDGLKEPEHVSISAAAEAVIPASLGSWIYVQAYEVVSVERARSFECAPSMRTEAYVLLDHFIDRVRLAHALDVGRAELGLCHRPTLGGDTCSRR